MSDDEWKNLDTGDYGKYQRLQADEIDFNYVNGQDDMEEVYEDNLFDGFEED